MVNQPDTGRFVGKESQLNARFHVLAILLAILLAGCTASSSQNPISASRTPNTLEVTTPQGEPKMTPSAAVNPSLNNLVEKAKEDLARQLSISMDQINLVEATEEEWTDSSLGCPQPGMEYLQVITPGYRILLDVDGTIHEYHSNRDAYLVYCNPPDMPTLPKP
jgi:hypothetical protein